MHTFRAAQPALLYLSPACIFSVLLVAAARGELADLWSYAEECEEDEVAGEKSLEARKAETEQSVNGRQQSLTEKREDILNGAAGEASPLKRRATRSSAKLAEPETL